MGFIKTPEAATIMDACIATVERELEKTLPALTTFNRPDSRNTVRTVINAIIQMQLLHMRGVAAEQHNSGATKSPEYITQRETLEAAMSAFNELFEHEEV